MRAQVGTIEDTLAIFDLSDTLLAELAGKTVRVALVDYLGNRWDADPTETD